MRLTAMRVLVIGLVKFVIGLARLPAALQAAGFEVAGLCLADSYLAHTRHFDGLWRLSAFPSNLVEFLSALCEAVAAWCPQLIIPGDDGARQALHRAILTGKLATLDPALARLVQASLGDPAYYATIEAKSQLIELARSLGVRAPPQMIVPNATEAQAFAGDIGFPVILKPDFLRAGVGVRVCRSPAELDEALAAHRPGKSIFNEPGRFAIQPFMRGPMQSVTLAASAGEILAAFALERVRSRPQETSPISVGRVVAGDDLVRMLVPLIARLGYTGFAGADFVRSEDTGEAYFLELNPRPTPTSHLGPLLGFDLASALRARLAGKPALAPTRVFADQVTLFPQEWLADPGSRYLREGYHDVPWNDLPLLRYITNNPPAAAMGAPGLVK